MQEDTATTDTSANCYVELRSPTVRSSESGAADMMRHLRTRQHLGKVLVICDRPELLLATARKQWMKLSRTIQKQRAMTLNADKILKYTHAIIHMQSMRFTTSSPLEDPNGDIYFVSPDALTIAPHQCLTTYIHDNLSANQATTLIDQLLPESLIVDYTHHLSWQELGLLPKAALEARIPLEWHAVRQFLQSRAIDIDQLEAEKPHQVELLDDALDTLLEAPQRFLTIANTFQRALELARPTKVSKEMRLKYDALMLLAHRVQALTTPAFHQQFLESYSEDDTFFLYDRGRALRTGEDAVVAPAPSNHHDLVGEDLEEVVTRHQTAGRKRLAAALQFRVTGHNGIGGARHSNNADSVSAAAVAVSN